MHGCGEGVGGEGVRLLGQGFAHALSVLSMCICGLGCSGPGHGSWISLVSLSPQEKAQSHSGASWLGH